MSTEASTTQPESSSEEEAEGPSSRGVASESSDSEDDQGGTVFIFLIVSYRRNDVCTSVFLLSQLQIAASQAGVRLPSRSF